MTNALALYRPCHHVAILRPHRSEAERRGCTFHVEVAEEAGGANTGVEGRGAEAAGFEVGAAPAPLAPLGDWLAHGNTEGIGRGQYWKEGCSCLFVAPCVGRFICFDWENREAAAKKNGFHGNGGSSLRAVGLQAPLSHIQPPQPTFPPTSS